MIDKSNWLFIRRALYDLKRQYGAEVTVYKLVDIETDLKIGKKTVTRTLHWVRRAIMLPEEENRQVEQGIALLSANKYFTAQAGFDLGKALFIFDARDLPNGFTFDLDDFIIVAGEYFKVTEIEEYEYDSGWVVKTHSVDGADLKVILDIAASNTMALSQATTETL